MKETQEKIKDSAKKDNKITRKKRLFSGHGFCAVVVFFFYLIILLFLLLLTGVGQRAVIQLTDKIVDSLEIDSVSGNLQEGLVLNNVQFKNKVIDFNVTELDLQLDLACLLDGKVCVEKFVVQQPNINLKKLSKDKTKTTHSATFPLPIDLQVKSIQINKLFFQSSIVDIKVGEIDTSFFVNNVEGIHLLPTKVNDVILNFSDFNNDKNTNKRDDKKSAIDWQKLEDALSKPILTKNNFIQLPVDMNIMSFSGKNWQFIKGNKDIIINELDLQAQGNKEQIQLKKLNIQSNIATLVGNGWLHTADNYPVNLLIDIKVPKLNNNSIVKNSSFLQGILSDKNHFNIVINGEMKNQVKLLIDSKGTIPFHIDSNANLTKERTPLNIKLFSKQIQYPLIKNTNSSYKVQNLDVDIKGNLLNYAINLSAEMKDKVLPINKVNAYARGGLTQLDIKNLKLKIDKGNANFNGRLNWYNGMKWTSNLHLDNFKFGDYLLKDLPGTLSGNLFTYGIVRNGEWAINIYNASLIGELSHRPFSLNTILKSSNDKPLDIKTFLLNYGNNHIKAKGYLNSQSQLEVFIDTPNLKGLLPTLQANLKGTIKISGQALKPEVNINLEGKDLAFQDASLKKINVITHIQSKDLIRGLIDIDLKDLEIKQFKVTDLGIIATGDEQEHNIKVKSKGTPLAINLDLNGHFNKMTGLWKGQFKYINIPSIIGLWKTNKSIDIVYDHKDKETVISPHCWNNPEASFCFDKELTLGSKGSIDFNIKEIDLNLINQFIKPNIVNGKIQGKGNLQWFQDKPIEAVLNLKSYNLALKKKVNYKKLHLNIPKFRLFTRLKNKQLNVQSFIYIEDQGNISSNIRVKNLVTTKDLAGTLQIQNVSLSIAKQLFSKGENLDGDIFADLNLDGSLNNPLLRGKLGVTNIQTKIKSMPFNIEHGNLDMNFFGNYSTLEGLIATNNSSLNIYGRTDWHDFDHWSSEVDITAKDFYLDLPILPTIAKVKISPDIYIKAQPHLLQLSGNVDIPWARIDVVGLPDTGIAVSPDLVILNGPNKSKPNKLLYLAKTGETQRGTKIESDLKISIGDDVNLKAYGLNTYLTGLLSLTQQKGTLGLYGQVELDRGSYKSFGQDLLIQKGYINFSGIPTKPAINIEAIRNPSTMMDKDITVGVVVSGYANKPKITVFSNPAMSQDQAFSYLFTGHSIENNNSENSSFSIGTALLTMSLAQSGKVVGDIGKVFGINNLNIGTAGSGDNSKIEVSGNLTQDLQVKYGVGLFDGVAELTLRYRLLPKLYIQTVSGISQAVDLLYQFEI